MPKNINNPKIPDNVRNLLRKFYAFEFGEVMRIENYDEELIEFDTNMRTELDRGTFFDNIGKLI